MHINIKATNIELTDYIREYVDKEINTLDKFIQAEPGSVMANVEVGKTTHHHKNGDVFRAEINLTINSRKLRSVSEKVDLRLAVDDAKAEMVRIITTTKDKERSLYKRGAAQVKALLKHIPGFRD